MKRHIGVIMFISIVYVVIVIIFRRMTGSAFEWGISTLLFTNIVAPLLLGVISSIIIKYYKGWLIGIITFLFSFLLTYIYIWISKYHLSEILDVMQTMVMGYLYNGIIGTISAMIGGAFVDYLRKKKILSI